MTRPISSLPNLGPRSEAAYARAGVRSAEQLAALGPDAAYARLLASGARPHFMAYLALALALMGRPWTDLGSGEKAELRARFQALKAARKVAPPGIEAELDRLGLGQPTSSSPEKK